MGVLTETCSWSFCFRLSILWHWFSFTKALRTSKNWNKNFKSYRFLRDKPFWIFQLWGFDFSDNALRHNIVGVFFYTHLHFFKNFCGHKVFDRFWRHGCLNFCNSKSALDFNGILPRQLFYSQKSNVQLFSIPWWFVY